MSKQDKPFNLTISTIDAHAPNGIFDKRCKNSTDNDSVNAIECTNDLLKDFVDFLKQQENYKDTIVVIVPDHLMMTSKATPMLIEAGERTLYSIFLNTGKIEKYNKGILYTDLAKMILDKLDIENNAKFIMYNYKNKSTDERVEQYSRNKNKIRIFNQRTIMQD